jgi:brefeldin A-inhibited guanine nucleotide-exchange protein
MNIVSKIGTTPSIGVQPKLNDPGSPGLSPTTKPHNAVVPPSLSTSALAVSGTLDTSVMGLSDKQLKRQGLECLVEVLKSLVAWGTTAGKTAADPIAEPGTQSQAGDENQQEIVVPDPSFDRLSMVPVSSENLRQPTPDNVADDPSKFESAKQKKTTLLEGIKKFNFKPKRVRGLLSLRYNSYP